jgi:formylglycine-generating enzyme required for sulfatase activity
MKNTIYITICFLIGVVWAFFSTDVKKSEEIMFQNEVFTVNGVSFKMIAVEGGVITMGCTPEQEGECYPDEGVATQKNISSFMIGETEVTQELWHAVMGNNPSKFKGDLNRPVERVSWAKCQEFIEKLNIENKIVNLQLPL